MSGIDTIACCERCGETAWILNGTVEQDHDCPAAGRPVTLSTCDLCDGAKVLSQHRGPCGRFCGCMTCERCEGTGQLALVVDGPALPDGLDHPYNAPPTFEEIMC